MTGPAAIEVERDGVEAGGPDAGSFLQGQLSQNVLDLAPGQSRWSLLLEPTGKTVAWLRVTFTGDDQYLLDVDGGHGAAVIDRLHRFLIRIKCTIEPVPLRLLAVRGPGALEVSADTAVRHDPGWAQVESLDLVGPTVDLPTGVTDLAPEDLDRLRIQSGIPAMGREITPDVIPAELELIGRSVDFDKGCYTGQELVARIDSRGGNVPRRLRVVEVAGAVPAMGAVVHGEGEDSGTLTSVAETPEGAVGLALVHRRVEAPADVTVRWDGAEAPARVHSVPGAG
jgi:folate-binding protein YgfZ